ncbi:hypothetical protein LCGC14_0405990 [marine sediment metagenome]|uniref:Uncharacterized protein n=1 Tax=marine sediment metagenome TaxID=412755 RepID=A0A0F9SV87_9ZZZZ
MTLQQSGKGGIRIFEDFCGPEWIIAETAASGALGALRVIGQGIETDDSGVIVNETDPTLSGVARLTTTDEDNHSCGLTTALCFDVAKMAPLVLECRVQFSSAATKEFFFGLSDVNTDTAILETGIVYIATANATTVVYGASDVCGFLFSAEATDSTDWHAVYKGGVAAAVTDSTELDLDNTLTTGEWQVLRLEVDNNGTVRWYIDGVLLKTLEGAVSTTTDLAAQAILQTLTTTSMTADLDYMLVKASRDWTI